MNTNWEKVRANALRLLRTHRIIPVAAQICPELESIVLECLTEALLGDLKEVTLLINSGGGDYTSAIAIANAIRLSKIKVRGVVVSRAMSSGIIVLQACHERVACTGASLLMHWGRTSLSNAEQEAIMVGDSDWVLSQIRAENKGMVALLTGRSGQSEGIIMTLCHQERRLSAQEALGFGLVDSVLNTFSGDQLPETQE